jgi:integrase
MKLTKATISGLTLPAGKQDAIFFDEELRGFGIRLRGGGKRTWIVQYEIAGQQRRLTIGRVELFSPDEARRLARDHLAKARLGKDPQREKEVAKVEARLTLGVVVERYLAARKGELRPKSFDLVSRYLRGHWRPLHSLPLNTVERRHVASRVGEITQASGPVAAKEARSALSAFYAWGISQGLVESNPVIGSAVPPARGPRERVLSDTELASIWQAVVEDDFGRIVRLLILTGQRRGEVAGMTWGELDQERGLWVIPSERAKNGRKHDVPLPPMAWAVIASVPHRLGNDHLFGQHGFQGFTYGKQALDQRLRLPPWTLHDIRRSVATGMAELRVAPHIVETILNHVGHKAGIAGVYNRALYEREVRAALALWGDHVRSIVEGDARKIVPLPVRA